MIIQLKTEHSEKNRVEAFLRALNEELEQLPFDWELLKESHRIIEAVRLTNANESLVITVIFLMNHADANLIAKENFKKETVRCVQNGTIMFVVESSDESKLSKVLSTFAGKE